MNVMKMLKEIHFSPLPLRCAKNNWENFPSVDECLIPELSSLGGQWFGRENLQVTSPDLSRFSKTWIFSCFSDIPKNVPPIAPQTQHIWNWSYCVPSKFYLLLYFMSRLLLPLRFQEVATWSLPILLIPSTGGWLLSILPPERFSDPYLLFSNCSCPDLVPHLSFGLQYSTPLTWKEYIQT